MIIKMETDQVRAMASKLRQTADSIEGSLTSIKQTGSSADWQSQAREEFIMHLEMLDRSTAQSKEVLRLMAQAAEQKAEQWEAIASVFNGPFHYLQGVWNSITNFLGGLWGGIQRAISAIQVPSLPSFLGGVVTIGGIATLSPILVAGGLHLINPGWIKEYPSWWPFHEQPVPEGKQDIPDGPPGTISIPGAADHKPSQQTKPSITSPKLREVTGNPSSYTCATYAQDRRPDLGTTQTSNGQYESGAAANYIYKYDDKAFQVDNSSGDLTEKIGKGYALVWEPDHPSANSTYGHVAIVENVYADHVIISEATSWPDGVYKIKTRKISIDQLNNDSVWLIP